MSATTLSAEDSAYLRGLIERHSAIVLDGSKDYLLETRLQPLARELGFTGLAELAQKARVDKGTLTTKIVEAMTTHETLFFRDLRPFETLRQHILPPLLESRAGKRSLHIWSAACSSGQEPYSVAMLLKEHFPDVCGWPPTIFATDLSKPVLERAKAGLFQQMEVNRGLPAQLLIKHFERTGTQWQLKEDLRRMVQFAPLNLLDPFPPTLRPDIVLLRNVLIYFSTETKRDILRRVRSVIAPDGWLLLGAAEAAHTVEDGWEVHTIDRTIWNRPRRSTP